jgi:hypothetical protein
MTAQVKDKLFYKGTEFSIATGPLGQYFSKSNLKPNFIFTGTANWRGYVGTWEIIDNKLFLIELNGYKAYQEKVGLECIFPDQKKVFADWFNGEIRIPHGKMLKYIHMGWASIFEKELFLDFKNGILINERLIENDPSKLDDDHIFYLKDE